MRIDDELAAHRPERDALLTIGVFDGVHRGHRSLLGQLVAHAERGGYACGVVTFRNHPASVLRADFQPQYLTTPEERIALLRETGVDFVAPVTFDVELSRLDARAFAQRLVSALRMRGLVVGADFAMGHGRGGDLPALTRLGEELGFSVRAVELLADGPQAVKSTTIRHALAAGDVAGVAQMLGRNFSASGVVVEGAKRGRTLGFPTANLETPQSMATPANGIYAAWAVFGDERDDDRGGERRMAAVSIGVRPTFANQPKAIEAYLLEYEGDLYGKPMRLEFVSYLREERKYDTIDALLVQMRADVEQTRRILESQPEANK